LIYRSRQTLPIVHGKLDQILTITLPIFNMSRWEDLVAVGSYVSMGSILRATETPTFPQMGPPMGHVGRSRDGIATSLSERRFSDLAFCKCSRFAARHPSQNAHKLGFRHPIGGPICGKGAFSAARRSADAWIFVVAE
jgi:hypothetical protein